MVQLLKVLKSLGSYVLQELTSLKELKKILEMIGLKIQTTEELLNL